MSEDQPIVFAYFHKGELKGFRADTFNTITEKYPKIYTYSKEQVAIVVENVKQGCNKVGQSFAKLFAGKNLVDTHGNPVDGDTLAKHLSRTEETFREWGEFELHVLKFPTKEEWYELGEGDEWKRKQILENLEPAIEVHKFKIIENEN